MPIIVDYNHTAISSLLGGAAQMKKAPHDMGIDFFRHMVLNALRNYRSKFKAKYGDLVIACDHPHSWRREAFPPYKRNRKKTRSASDINWKVIFEWMGQLQDELRESFPYPVLQRVNAEADDVIAAIVRHHAASYEEADFGPLSIPVANRTLIVSGDDDFMQLQIYPSVDQYLPVKGRFAKLEIPARQFLKEHTLEGDTGDGIPNALSGDNVLITPGVRQTPLRAKIKEAAMAAEGEELLKIAPHFARNNMLINLIDPQVPVLDELVVRDYTDQLNILTREECSRRRQQLLTYFMTHRMKHLTEYLGDF